MKLKDFGPVVSVFIKIYGQKYSDRLTGFGTVAEQRNYVTAAEYQKLMFGRKIKLRDIIVQIFLDCIISNSR